MNMHNAMLAHTLLSGSDAKETLSKILSPGGSRRTRVREASAAEMLRMPKPGERETWQLTPATAGASDAMVRLRSQVGRIAPYFRTALITGPEGTGKVDVARMLHALSPCATGEFVACEASAMAEAMMREDGRAIMEAVLGARSTSMTWEKFRRRCRVPCCGYGERRAGERCG